MHHFVVVHQRRSARMDARARRLRPSSFLPDSLNALKETPSKVCMMPQIVVGVHNKELDAEE